MIVTSPEAEPAREAEFLLERLAATDMPVGELIVNRVNTYGLRGVPADELAGLLAPALGEQLRHACEYQPRRLRPTGGA